MYTVKITGRFKKDVELCRKRGYDTALLRTAITILSETGTLPESYKPHRLKGEYVGHWEAHLQPDWLLVWKKQKKTLILILTATGTHTDLFG